MTDDSKRRTVETLAPACNFTVSLKDKVRAAAGPPAYALRRRRIEDLEALVVESLAAVLAKVGDADRARDVALATGRIMRNLEELRRLVDAHNRYFPTEANLAIDITTGGHLERGRPWQPLAPPALDALFVRAQQPGCERD